MGNCEIDLAIRTRLEEASEGRTGLDVALTALGTIIWHCRRERPMQERAQELRTIAAIAENAVLTAEAQLRAQRKRSAAE